MLSTYEGATKRAKKLHRVLDDCGFIFSLNQAQAALAQGGGFRDWHALKTVLSKGERPTDPTEFRRRMLAALPPPCQSPTRAWLDGELNDIAIEAGVPPRYFRDVLPYVLASVALHRSRTAILRPGSGPGQRLREDLVIGLLLNRHGGQQPWPRLDPFTFDLVFEGELHALFQTDMLHARFEEEFRRLQASGLLAWSNGRLRISPPDVDALVAHVHRHRVNKAEHWGQDELHSAEAADALRDALSAIGIDNARRVADAIAQQGSAAYITPSGAVLSLLTELAEQGEIAMMARVYGLLARIHPANSRFVRESVPAKIGSNYFTGRLRLGANDAVAWAKRTPDWEAQLEAALVEPAAFVSTVDRMAAEIRAGRPG